MQSTGTGDMSDWNHVLLLVEVGRERHRFFRGLFNQAILHLAVVENHS